MCAEIKKKLDLSNCGSVHSGKPHPNKPVYIWALPKLQFDPPLCANPGTLWHNYFAENEKILKTAIWTLGMNILTVTNVKDDSEMVF